MSAQQQTPDWEAWIRYFERNALNVMPIDWQEKYRISPLEATRITRSIQQFQLGESSEGKHLQELARRFATSTGEHDYLPALQLFIKEEQRHSQFLARFMAAQQLPLSRTNPVDSIFRFLRRAFTLELAIMAMLTAEIIAVSYYKSLHDATASKCLRQICRQLLRDEAQHLQFQVETLRRVRRNRSPAAIALSDTIHRVLFGGALLVVWQQHRPVLNAGGYTTRKFWRVNWQRFNRLFAEYDRLHAEVTV